MNATPKYRAFRLSTSRSPADSAAGAAHRHRPATARRITGAMGTQAGHIAAHHGAHGTRRPVGGHGLVCDVHLADQPGSRFGRSDCARQRPRGAGPRSGQGARQARAHCKNAVGRRNCPSSRHPRLARTYALRSRSDGRYQKVIGKHKRRFAGCTRSGCTAGKVKSPKK